MTKDELIAKLVDALAGLLSREHAECRPEPGQACSHVVAAEAAIIAAGRK